MTILHSIDKLGQSIWYDNIHRGQLDSGYISNLIEKGITGLTSNPTIFEKAIDATTAYDSQIISLSNQHQSTMEIYENIVVDDIRRVCDLLLDTYFETQCCDGYASLEVNPHLSSNTDQTVEEACRLYNLLDRPNLLMKVPATPEGIIAIRQLISKGINVNVTLLFSRSMYDQVRKAYMDGLEGFLNTGGDITKVFSVASFFISRIDTYTDKEIEKLENRSNLTNTLLGKIAIANAQLAYLDFQGDFASNRFLELKKNGAQVQKVLWASTSTKNPSYSDLKYADALIGNNTINTMTDVTIDALLAAEIEGMIPSNTIDNYLTEPETTMKLLSEAGIQLSEITSQLLVDGLNSFSDSFDSLISKIRNKQEQLTLDS